MNKEARTTTHLSTTPATGLEQRSDSSPLCDLIQLLQSVDTTSEIAKLNEVSMSDNNGGRIWF